VKASPTSLAWPPVKGLGPRIQLFRTPFFKSTVVKVAVVMLASASR
jgi:hypothetical protein